MLFRSPHHTLVSEGHKKRQFFIAENTLVSEGHKKRQLSMAVTNRLKSLLTTATMEDSTRVIFSDSGRHLNVIISDILLTMLHDRFFWPFDILFTP